VANWSVLENGIKVCGRNLWHRGQPVSDRWGSAQHLRHRGRRRHCTGSTSWL